MALSDAALREVAKVLRKYVEPEALEQIAAELVEIRGDKDFRDTIERLVHALRMMSGQ
jgi:16S rRNA C1402 N4-methylase RsmH